jgi:hypothetical protein
MQIESYIVNSVWFFFLVDDPDPNRSQMKKSERNAFGFFAYIKDIIY